MLELEEWFMIRQLYEKDLPITEIPSRLGISRTTVYKYLKEVPKSIVRSPKPSILDPYKPYLSKRILQDGVLICEVLLDEIRKQGYPEGKSILKDYVKPFRHKPKTQIPIRFKTEPGEQAQIDWMDLGIHSIEGENRRLYGFVFTLCILE